MILEEDGVDVAVDRLFDLIEEEQWSPKKTIEVLAVVLSSAAKSIEYEFPVAVGVLSGYLYDAYGFERMFDHEEKGNLQ